MHDREETRKLGAMADTHRSLFSLDVWASFVHVGWKKDFLIKCAVRDYTFLIHGMPFIC